MIFWPFALGLSVAFLGWIGLGLVRSGPVRAICRSGWVAFWATPTIVGGHGIAVLSAYYLLFAEPLHPFALVPIAVVWLLGGILLLAVGPLRRLGTEWPLDPVRALVHPAYPRLLLYGVLALLLFGSLFDAISEHWQGQLLFLLVGGLACYLCCFHAARRFGRTEMSLPLAFAAPIAITGILAYAILWYLAGLGGLLAATRRPRKALWLGAGTFGILGVLSVLRTLRAIEYEGVSHVTIQGGVAGNAGVTAACLLLAVLCLFLAWRCAAGRAGTPS